jgi:hypothetical protein
MKRPPAPLLPDLPRPMRWFLGMGLLGLGLWVPAMIALFR